MLKNPDDENKRLSPSPHTLGVAPLDSGWQTLMSALVITKAYERTHLHTYYINTNRNYKIKDLF